jgi:hypothetical protein
MPMEIDINDDDIENQTVDDDEEGEGLSLLDGEDGDDKNSVTD